MGWGIYILNIKFLCLLEFCQYAAKCSEKAVFFGLIWGFLHMAPRKMTALTRNSKWTYWSKCFVYIPNPKSLRHLEVCQYAAKCSENAGFFYFFGIFKKWLPQK